MELNLKYSIIDVECLEDYFSLQAKSEINEDVTVFECYTDKDCYTLYELLKRATRPMYAFSIDYDKAMINSLCKLVEKKERNILKKLREISDYIIVGKIDYFRLNKEFWVDHMQKIQKSNEYIPFDEVYKMAIKKMKSIYCNNKQICGFIDQYNNIFGKSKVFKNLIINSIPKIYYYYNIAVDKTIKPSISLKKLQLIKEGYNIKFDFSKYTKIADIIADGKFETWIKYSKNDVLFLEKLFLDKPKDDIVKRFYAYKAVKSINPDIEIDINDLYSENNTALINKILAIKNPIKDFDINYEDYIKTNYPDFNHFVSFVNQNNYIQKDRDLKVAYCENYNKTYIQDDKTIWNNDKIDVLTGSFDELTIGGVKIKFGLGGLHGAITNYIGENLIHLDYTSQYPSIILQYKHLFKNIINVELYEAVYNMRVSAKAKLETLVKGTPEYEETALIVEGLKLILNSSYGLINSNFTIAISNKKLGRFICLKGQSLLINLAEKLINKSNKILLVNNNTDGIICKVPKEINIDDIIENDKDGYFVLGVKKYKNIIQKDVNSYILDGKVKGAFNIKVKQNINRHGRISVNTINAIKLIQNKDIELLPIYFDTKWIDKEEKAYYFTTKEHGQQAIKQTKKPEILTIDNEIYYFTDDIEKADLTIYRRYAELTKEKILDFTWVNSENTSIPFIEIELIPDDEDNIKVKRKIKRDLYKLLKPIGIGSKYIGFVGYKGEIKANSFLPIDTPIKPLIHYKMTDIQASTYCQGFSLHNTDNEFIIIDIDVIDKKSGKAKNGSSIIKDLILILKDCETFEAWNNKTMKYNRKYIFKNNSKLPYKINDKYKNYIEIIDKAVIWSNEKAEKVYEYQGEFKDIPENIISKLLVKA